jgi:uncharacterized membrane protein YgdD (TMEM256/DUF423 family)
MSAGWFAAGAGLAGVGVALGAFGAHGLRSLVDADRLAIWETGVRYHLVHALALLAVAWAADRWPGPAVTAAGWAFVVGIAIFAGSLYALVLTGARWLGAITPIGGVAFLAGWALLLWTALRSKA